MGNQVTIPDVNVIRLELVSKAGTDVQGAATLVPAQTRSPTSIAAGLTPTAVTAIVSDGNAALVSAPPATYSSTPSASATSGPPTVQTQTPKPLVTLGPTLTQGTPQLVVKEIQTRVTEEASIWWRYAWRLTVENSSPQPMSFDAQTEWHDKDGFILDTDSAYGLMLGPGEERTFTGHAFISLPSAGDVASVVAAVVGQEVISQPTPQLVVKEIQTRVTEKANIWWRYAWRLTVENSSPQAMSFDAQTEWHDKDGFIIDTDSEYRLILGPGEERTFTGHAFIKLPSAGDVASVVAAVVGQEVISHPAPQLVVKEIQTRVTEKASIWWRYAWRLTVENSSPQTLSFDTQIEWHDKDGFIIDTDSEYRLMLGPSEERTFTGHAFINLPSASDVASVVASVVES